MGKVVCLYFGTVVVCFLDPLFGLMSLGYLAMYIVLTEGEGL